MAKLYFYYAAMNAGKSTVLLQSSYNYNERGMDTLLYTPSVDTRYGRGLVVSRIGLKSKAISFDTAFDFYNHIEYRVSQDNFKLACVFIDEAQFLKKAQVQQLADVADVLNVPVLTYGLRTDFRSEPFEGSKYLLAWADELVEIKTICHCGRKATMNMRVDGNLNPVRSGKQIEIGGNELYIATCRKHFNAGIAKAEAYHDNVVPLPHLISEED